MAFERDIFGLTIYYLRVNTKESQSDIARLLGVSKTQVSDLENGKTTTTIEKLWLLADHFDVSIDYLVGRTRDPKRY